MSENPILQIRLENAKEKIEAALSDWCVEVTVTEIDTEEQSATARFELWNMDVEAPLDTYDGEIWIGNEDTYHAPVTRETVWIWLASHFRGLVPDNS